MALLPDARESVDRLLLRRYRKHGDVAARDRLVERWQPALRSFVRPYVDRGQPVEDLMQVANLGLIKALDGFDPTRKRRLMSFVAPTVQGEIKRHFRDHSRFLHVPRAAQELHARVLNAADERPRDDPGAMRDLATRLGLDPDQVDQVLRADGAFHPRSIDTPNVDRDDATPLEGALGEVDPGFEQAEERATLDATLNDAHLDETDREILRLRVEDDLLQREIAERVGVSQMQISRRLTEIAGVLTKHGRRLTRRPRNRRSA